MIDGDAKLRTEPNLLSKPDLESLTLYATGHYYRPRNIISEGILLGLTRMHRAGSPGRRLVGRALGAKGRASSAR